MLWILSCPKRHKERMLTSGLCVVFKNNKQRNVRVHFCPSTIVFLIIMHVQWKREMKGRNESWDRLDYVACSTVQYFDYNFDITIVLHGNV